MAPSTQEIMSVKVEDEDKNQMILQNKNYNLIQKINKRSSEGIETSKMINNTSSDSLNKPRYSFKDSPQNNEKLTPIIFSKNIQAPKIEQKSLDTNQPSLEESVENNIPKGVNMNPVLIRTNGPED